MPLPPSQVHTFHSLYCTEPPSFELMCALVFVVSSIRISRSGPNDRKRKTKEKSGDDDTRDFGNRPLPDMSFVPLG